jgi:hypothetical protein
VQAFIEDAEFQYVLSAYQYTKLWGMPNGNGWANEPTDLLDGITALEIEAKTIENEEMNAANKPKGSSALGGRSRGI